MTSWTKELDEAAMLATVSGRWHLLLFYLLCALAAVPTSFLVFSQVFTNATPEHWCAPPPELKSLGLSDEMLRSWTVPEKAGSYETCIRYTLDLVTFYRMLEDNVTERSVVVQEGGSRRTEHTKELVPVEGQRQRQEQAARIQEAVLASRSQKPVGCPNGWRFSNAHYQSTLVTEFNLVCDNDWLPRISNTLFWVGSIFGNVFFGWVSDRYGRRPTILVMIALEVPLTIAASFPGSYWSYIALRIAGGLFFPALYQLPFILALELMPPNKRTYTGIVVGMLFAAGMCLLSLLAFLIRDWFYLSLATTLPFVSLLSYYWLIPESPRWLVGRGRIAEAEKVYQYIAKKNGIILPRGFLLKLHKKIKDQEYTESKAAMLSNVQNRVVIYQDFYDKEYIQRRLNNMLPFKPDPQKAAIVKECDRIENLEVALDLEVDDLLNTKTKLSKEVESLQDQDDINEESHLNSSIQTELSTKSAASTLRRKSIQLMNRMLSRDDGDDVENKILDEQNSEGDCKASLLDIFRYPNIRKKFIILTFDWVALGVVYNSLSYNTPNLGVDDYLAFFIGGAVELPSYFVAWRCMERFGRRWVLCVFMCVGGLACLSCLFIPDFMPWVTVSLAMLGRLCAAASFAVFYVLIGELLPTVLRAQAMGAASFISGLGLLTCPYIVFLAKYSRALPLTVMGILSILGGVTSLFLPETLNQPLPQTLGDGEMFGRKFKLLSCVAKQSER